MKRYVGELGTWYLHPLAGKGAKLCFVTFRMDPRDRVLIACENREIGVALVV